MYLCSWSGGSDWVAEWHTSPNTTLMAWFSLEGNQTNQRNKSVLRYFPLQASIFTEKAATFSVQESLMIFLGVQVFWWHTHTHIIWYIVKVSKVFISLFPWQWWQVSISFPGCGSMTSMAKNCITKVWLFYLLGAPRGPGTTKRYTGCDISLTFFSDFKNTCVWCYVFVLKNLGKHKPYIRFSQPHVQQMSPSFWGLINSMFSSESRVSLRATWEPEMCKSCRNSTTSLSNRKAGETARFPLRVSFHSWLLNYAKLCVCVIWLAGGVDVFQPNFRLVWRYQIWAFMTVTESLSGWVVCESRRLVAELDISLCFVEP